MTSPSDTGGGSAASKSDAIEDESGAWGAETDFDNLEKEASKIFAVWELAPSGDAAPAAAAPVVEEKETWTAAPAPVVAAPPAPVIVAPVAAPAIVAPVAAAPVIVAPPAPVVAPVVVEAPAVTEKDLPSVVVAAEPAPAAPKVVIAHTAPPAALPDLPAAAPVRPSSRPPAMAAPVAVRPAPVAAKPIDPGDDPVVLPSTPPYGVMAAAAVGVVALLGFGGWYLTRTPAPPVTYVAPVTAVAAPPSVASAPPTSVAVTTPPAVTPPPVTAAAIAAVAAPPSVVAPVAPPTSVAAAVVAPPPVVAPPAPPPPPQHRLRVAVTPSDSTLTLDGVMVVNPLDRQINDGPHVLIASHAGFESDTQSLTTEHDRTLQVRLRAVAPPTPPPAPPRPPAVVHHPTSSGRLASHVQHPPHLSTRPPARAPAASTGRRGASSTLVTESPY